MVSFLTAQLKQAPFPGWGGMGCRVCEGSETYPWGLLSLSGSSSPVAMVLSYGV